MDQQMLFEQPKPDDGGGLILAAANATITALNEHGALDATHTLKVELIRAGAHALDVEFAKNKLTVAATTLYTKVIEVADGLPTIQQVVSTQFEQMVDALNAAD